MHQNAPFTKIFSGGACPQTLLANPGYIQVVPRNSIQLLNINTTKFQVEREPVYEQYDCMNSMIVTVMIIDCTWNCTFI